MGSLTWLRTLLHRRGIFLYRNPPRGTILARDLKRACPGYEVRTVFDVGANVGQTIERCRQDFPQAKIWSFEPSRRTFDRLQSRYGATDGVTLVNAALGPEVGPRELVQTSFDTMSHIRAPEIHLPSYAEATGTESVDMTTLDSYCASSGIDHIDFMKIDTEGFDLDVLRGGEDMLRLSAIDLVQCECGMNPDNRFHRAFGEIVEHMFARRYRLFGIYDQYSLGRRSAVVQSPFLYRSEAVFVSADLGVRFGEAPPQG